MKTRYKIIIIGISIPIAILGIMIFGIVPLMYITNGYSGFMMSIISDEEFEKDFAKIPEVKFFIEKYPNYTTNHSSDFLGWKIINYDGDVGQNDVHLSVKKSVLHQGVKVSAGCEVGVSSGYALNILDDKVMDYLKNDTCEKKPLKIHVCRGGCTDDPIYNEQKELQLKKVVEHCDYQKKIESGEIPERNEDGSWNVADSIGLTYQNSTHYIDNNICEWREK